MIDSAISSGVMAPRSSPAGAFKLRQPLGRDAAFGQRLAQRLGFAAAADEGDVVGVDRERRQQRGLVAAALGRDHDIAGAASSTGSA